MVIIDTVYQKVLALANKEQRGYVTPQEFNLLADKAQLEIFESYFHDMKTAYHKPKNQMGVVDELELLSEKLWPFRRSASQATTANITLGTDIYKLDTVSLDGVELVELNEKEILYTENNPLTKATNSRRVYVRKADSSNALTLYPSLTAQTTFDITYWKKPTKPEWAYVIVDDSFNNPKPLYNSFKTTNFELHPSEEENLVTRILYLAGVIIEAPGLIEIAMADKTSTKQEQND